MFKVLLTSVLFSISFLGFWLSQEKVITGKVTWADDGSALSGVMVKVKGTSRHTTTDEKGEYAITVLDSKAVLEFSYIGYVTQKVKVGERTTINVKMKADATALNEVVVIGYGTQQKRDITGSVAGVSTTRKSKSYARSAAPAAQYDQEYSAPTIPADQMQPEHNTENYATIQENIFHEATRQPLSTFSIDVDAASYSNIRRFINQGQKPPKDAVRIEEMINYFTYDYPQPAGEAPFSINTEVSACPWNADHSLVHIGLQGKKVPMEQLPPSNLVFLVDVSGSMQDPNKLPLVKTSFSMLVEQLRPQDHVAIVVYAGAAGLVLPPTPGNEKTTIMDAISRLEAGGSTAGGAGIKLAYQTALEHFKKEGNNRVILATDGDFNVGVSSDAEMERLIEEKRKLGVFLTVLGFGMGNYKDSKMEVLADKGNGNYAYIDSAQEGRKVFVNEFGGTLFTIAKDVKLQIEFNPAQVKAYRLIGYENRRLRDEEFNDDKKDAGELGSGHTVTALYEIIPVGSKEEVASVDKLKYQQNSTAPTQNHTSELLNLKLRYKKPDSDVSQLIEHPVKGSSISLNKTSDNFRFSAAVAEFGLLLRESEFKGKATLSEVLDLASGARGKDEEGYRAEFINLVKSSQFLQAKR